MSEPLLSIRDLSVEYRSKEGTVYAVNGASIDVQPRKITALVGESGSGKTSIALSALKLLPNNARVTQGEVQFRGDDLLKRKGGELRNIRGREVAMIFQDAVSGLNPVLKIGEQVGEVLENHLSIPKKEARRRAVDVLAGVGLSDPERVAKAYPYQLSGGMCQRVMVAMATALEPDVLIADEPTSALDVTIQAQVLREIRRLATEHGTGILLITHNLGVVAQVSDDVAVLYNGAIVERGDTVSVMRQPLHPYTHALLGALPRIDTPRSSLQPIGGELPDATVQATHCVFIERCNKILNRCRAEGHPPLESPDHDGHDVACYNPIWQIAG